MGDFLVINESSNGRKKAEGDEGADVKYEQWKGMELFCSTVSVSVLAHLVETEQNTNHRHEVEPSAADQSDYPLLREKQAMNYAI